MTRFDLQEMRRRLSEINQIGETPSKGVTRLAFTREEEAALELCEKWMADLGLSVRRDAFGNLFARRPGRRDSPVVMTGSHLDTVPEGGKYDGAVGVLCAFEALRGLVEMDVDTEFPVEMVVFRAEESSRFGAATLGSRALAGHLPSRELDQLQDAEGVTLAEAMRDSDLDPEKIEDARYDPERLKAFVEVHVEQGSVLESHGDLIGVVTHIAAPTRLMVRVKGESRHSGSTPMEERRDALAAASELVLAVESAAWAEREHGTVGTVGVLRARPGAMNVIPGEVELGIDVRGIHSNSKERVIGRIRSAAAEIERRRHVKVAETVIADQQPVTLDPDVQQSIIWAADQARYSWRRLYSPAGHDAAVMSHITPTGLIFLPSRGGVSHNPLEHTDIEHVAAGAAVLFRTLCRLAGANAERFGNQVKVG